MTASLRARAQDLLDSWFKVGKAHRDAGARLVYQPFENTDGPATASHSAGPGARDDFETTPASSRRRVRFATSSPRSTCGSNDSTALRWSCRLRGTRSNAAEEAAVCVPPARFGKARS